MPLSFSISEPYKVQKFQFQTSAILIFTFLLIVQKLHGLEISQVLTYMLQVLPYMLQFLDNLWRHFFDLHRGKRSLHVGPFE